MLRSRLLALALAVAALALSAGAPQVAAQGRSDAFRAAPCMFEVPQNLPEGERIECGYLTVPLRHGEADGPTIELAVAIVRSAAETARPDPLVMLQGGPGGSTIDTYIQYISIGRLDPILAARDIILFDQRGTLYSEPALTCPEQLDLTLSTIERRVPRAEATQLSLDAMQACRQRLTASGVDLAAFNSLENAADVDALRAALGYEQINLYGVSYGTLLALHTMRDYPGGLRSVILDAVVPTQTNFIEEVPRSQDRAFSELFAACAADAGCSASYPDLERVFFELVERLNREPARMELLDSETGRSYQAVIDGDSFQSVVFQMLYSSELLPALPRAIYGVRDGETTLFTRVLPQIVFDRTFSSGMYHSVICAEDADFAPADVRTDGVRPELAAHAREDAQAMLDSCAVWGVPELDAPLDRPVASDVPTLVLGGRFDPITPPANGAEAARTLSRSYVYTFGAAGHGAATSGACPLSVVGQFLDDPQQAPDASCADAQPAPEFLSGATVRDAPGLAAALGDIERGGALRLLAPVICLIGMLSLFLIWPLIWLIRLLQGRAQRSPALARAAQLVAVANTALGLLFVVGAVAAVIQISQQGRDIVLLYGVPAAWGWLLAVPWVCAGLSALMLAGAALAWARRYWSVPERVYYSLLTLAGLVMSGGLAALM